MSNIHSKPIAERIDWLFELAHRHGKTFRSPEAWLARERYLSEHPTAIAVLKCMDGRINIPIATNTPIGLLMPFRNLGGMFDLGWPYLGEVLSHHVLRMTRTGRRVLILITYHWSKGNPLRGCAGFHFDTKAAIAHTHEIRNQVEHIFGSGHGTVYPLVCGFETDDEALVMKRHWNRAWMSFFPTCRSRCAPTSCRYCTATLSTSHKCENRHGDRKGYWI
jgi:hypothetical protein